MNPFEYAQRVQSSRNQLYRTAFCYVKNEQDALDIVSDAVCKGLASLNSLREPAYFDTWITRIVINAALSHLRRPGSRPCNREEIPLDIP